MTRAGGWLISGVWFSLVLGGCVIEQRRSPPNPAPATVQPVGTPPASGQGGPGQPPAGVHGFHGGAPGATGGAVIPQGAVRGRPRGMHPGAPATLWIWLNQRGQWRVRTTTAGQRRQFRGAVMGATSALEHVTCSRREICDGVVLRDGAVEYDFVTEGHIDGFDFWTADGGCVRFDTRPSESSEAYRIFVGRERRKLGAPAFVLCP